MTDDDEVICEMGPCTKPATTIAYWTEERGGDPFNVWHARAAVCIRHAAEKAGMPLPPSRGGREVGVVAEPK